MKKIYIIEYCFFQDGEVIATFSTKKLAEKYMEKMGIQDFSKSDFTINEYDIDPNYPDKS